MKNLIKFLPIIVLLIAVSGASFIYYNEYRVTVDPPLLTKPVNISLYDTLYYPRRHLNKGMLKVYKIVKHNTTFDKTNIK